MKFPGKLEAGLRSGILTEAKYIKGTYIVFPTFDDMYELSFKDCNCDVSKKEGVLIEGVKCFLVENTNSEHQTKYPGNNEYRWTGSDWELLPTPFFDAPTNGKVYGRLNGEWHEIILDEQSLKTEFENIWEAIDTKQSTLISGTNIKTYYGESILGEGNLTTPIATTTEVGGIVSGISNVENGTEYPVEISSINGVGSVKIPPLSATTTVEELINILEQGGDLTLNGGTAPVQGDTN